MIEPKVVTIGGMRLTCEPCNCVGDTCTMMIVAFPGGAYARIHHDEWKALVSAAARNDELRRMVQQAIYIARRTGALSESDEQDIAEIEKELSDE